MTDETIHKRARVLRTNTFYQHREDKQLRVGDVVTLTRSDSDYMLVATDLIGTWGSIGHTYQLLEDDDE